MQYLGIDHIGIAVLDLEKATDTYGELLGFECTGEEVMVERGIKVRFFDTNNERIELLGALSDNSEISGFLNKRGEGVHHICLRVDNIHKAVTSLEKRGLKIVGGGIKKGAHGSLVAFIHPKETHGVLLELVELPADQS
jgi:methylmalonyl-CoA epimerase